MAHIAVWPTAGDFMPPILLNRLSSPETRSTNSGPRLPAKVTSTLSQPLASALISARSAISSGCLGSRTSAVTTTTAK